MTDPYIIPIPSKVSRSDGAPSDEFVQWLIYDNRFKHDLWQYVVGPSNTIDDIKNDIVDVESRVDQLETDVEALRESYDYYSINSSRTTAGNEFIRANAELTITLNSNPEPYERVYVQLTADVTVTISGSINDTSEIKMHRAYDTVELVYFSDISGWIIK